jgi:hypothetical protein
MAETDLGIREEDVRRIVREEMATPRRLHPNCRREDFDGALFYQRLNHVRKTVDVDWAYISRQTGVSATTLSRMALGRHPDAASLAALSAWAGIDPAKCIVRAAAEIGRTTPKEKA